MGFSQALSGLNAASQNLDVIGNNVANSSTVGFKSGQAEFADVFAASLSGAGASPVGLGTKVAAVTQQFTQGNITATSNPLDIAINGGGFFRMSNSGTITYSRNGQFELDKNGFIVNSSGLRLTGYPASSTGVINTGSLSDLQIDTSDIAPQATGGSSAATGVTAQLNLNSGATSPTNTTFTYTDSTSYNNTTPITIYDSLGTAHTYTMYFAKSAANTWDVYATMTNSDGTVTDLSSGGTTKLGTINFTSSGAIDTTTTTLPFSQSITSAQLGTGASALTFNVDFTGTTQYGGNFSVNTLKQDGYALGALSNFNIGSDGIIVGSYTNGQSKDLGQVVLASFRNPQGLQPLGGNQWAETSDSGNSILGAPSSSGSFGALQSSAVEDSNVDLTAELVNMITAQRNYQANAQTIKTQDQIMQTLVNLP